ncbi:MAG: hypothetical protein CM15mP32_0660 [Flavobacteriaceae bacterium]|nr:MAG: hypothetical protein CM15mP32_0660 [Flavobacteriaceae bacterium]
MTLGCSKNIYDSEVLMGQLQANDKQVVHEKEGNIVVVNTCGLSTMLKKNLCKPFSILPKKGRRINDKLFVTGCLSERYKDDLQQEIPEVDQFLAQQIFLFYSKH